MKLKSLRQALSPLTKFGQDEISFEVDPGGSPVQVFLRPLLPKEEIECQKRAREILVQAREEEEGEEVSRAAAIEYFDKFRIEVISYALSQVGDEDFRGVKLVETEEALPNGTPVRVPLHQALRDLISDEWSRSMITICWTKYGDLMTKIAQRAEKVAEQTLADLDAEILRASEKLEKLKVERLERAKGDPSVTMDQIRAITNLGQALEEEVEDVIQRAQAERELKKTLDEQDQEEDWDEGPPPRAEAPPPPRAEAPPPPRAEAPPPRKPVTPAVAPPPTSKPPSPSESFVSSFGDPDDPESLLLQEQEAMRILEAQRKSRSVSSSEISRDLSQAQPMGQVPSASGQMIDAYRLPSETISSRGHKDLPTTKREAPKGNHNPNFVPPRR
jgi:hypothetical protein